MQIRRVVEPGDIVRMGQKQHVNISNDEAKRLLASNSGVICHELDDVIEKHLVRVVAVVAQARSKAVRDETYKIRP